MLAAKLKKIKIYYFISIFILLIRMKATEALYVGQATT